MRDFQAFCVSSEKRRARLTEIKDIIFRLAKLEIINQRPSLVNQLFSFESDEGIMLLEKTPTFITIVV